MHTCQHRPTWPWEVLETWMQRGDLPCRAVENLHTAVMYSYRKQQLFLLCAISTSPLRRNWLIFRNLEHLFHIEADFLILWWCSSLGRSEIRGTRWPGTGAQRGNTVQGTQRKDCFHWLKSGWDGVRSVRAGRLWSTEKMERIYRSWITNTHGHTHTHTHLHRPLFIIGVGWLLVHIWNWLHNFTLIINQTATVPLKSLSSSLQINASSPSSHY